MAATNGSDGPGHQRETADTNAGADLVLRGKLAELYELQPIPDEFLRVIQQLCVRRRIIEAD
ncbi:MAG TPA: hypothetical protein VF342_05320 [Alphaproteobacteria bacterium]